MDREYPVFYENIEVGIYKTDFVIENKVVIEIEAVKCFDENHKAQLIYLLVSWLTLAK